MLNLQKVTGKVQDNSLISRAPKINGDTAKIRWDEQTAVQLERLNRGISHQVLIDFRVSFSIKMSLPELELRRAGREWREMVMARSEGDSQGKEGFSANFL